MGHFSNRRMLCYIYRFDMASVFSLLCSEYCVQMFHCFDFIHFSSFTDHLEISDF